MDIDVSVPEVMVVKLVLNIGCFGFVFTQHSINSGIPLRYGYAKFTVLLKWAFHIYNKIISTYTYAYLYIDIKKRIDGDDRRNIF